MTGNSRTRSERSSSRGRPRNLIAMSQLRHDPLSGLDVIVAAGRAARPVTFRPGPRPTPDWSSARSAPATRRRPRPRSRASAAASPNGPGGWSARSRTCTRSSTPTRSSCSRPTTTAPSPISTTTTPSRSSRLLRDRVRAFLERATRSAFAIVNHLREAGASIAHPHAQVFALEVGATRGRGGAGARGGGGRRPRARSTVRVTDLVVAQARRRHRLVPARVDLAVPVPRRARTTPASASTSRPTTTWSTTVAIALRDALRRLRAVARRRAATTSWCTPRPATARTFHWYVEVTPRVSVIAGFEQATGVLVNTVPPEDAAVALRAVVRAQGA